MRCGCSRAQRPERQCLLPPSSTRSFHPEDSLSCRPRKAPLFLGLAPRTAASLALNAHDTRPSRHEVRGTDSHLLVANLEQGLEPWTTHRLSAHVLKVDAAHARTAGPAGSYLPVTDACPVPSVRIRCFCRCTGPPSITQPTSRNLTGHGILSIYVWDDAEKITVYRSHCDARPDGLDLYDFSRGFV